MTWADCSRLSTRIDNLLAYCRIAAATKLREKELVFADMVEATRKMVKEFAGEPDDMGPAIATTWQTRAIEVSSMWQKAEPSLEGISSAATLLTAVSYQAAAIIFDMASYCGGTHQALFGYDAAPQADAWVHRSTWVHRSMAVVPKAPPITMIAFIEARATDLGVTPEQIRMSAVASMHLNNN